MKWSEAELESQYNFGHLFQIIYYFVSRQYRVFQILCHTHFPLSAGDVFLISRNNVQESCLNWMLHTGKWSISLYFSISISYIKHAYLIEVEW